MQEMEVTPERKERSLVDSVDLKSIYAKILGNWKLFAVCLVVFITIADFKNRYAADIYQLETSILISPDKLVDNAAQDLAQKYVMTRPREFFLNEVEVLTSMEMTKKVISQLDFEVSYFRKGAYKLTEIYDECPFYIDYDNNAYQLLGLEFNVKIINEEEYQLSLELPKRVAGYNYSTRVTKYFYPNAEFVEGVYRFGELVDSELFNFKLELQPNVNFNSGDYVFTFHDYRSLVLHYNGVIGANGVKDASVMKLSMTGPNKSKIVNYLNTLTAIFIHESTNSEREESKRTMDFIEGELGRMSANLKKSGDNLSDFQESRGVVDYSFESKELLRRKEKYEDQLLDLNNKLSYFQGLKDYLQKHNDYSLPIAPSGAGIEDPLLLSLSEKLHNLSLEKEQLSESKSAGNPEVIAIQSQINNTRDALLENVTNLTGNTKRNIWMIQTKIGDLTKEKEKLPAIQKGMFSKEQDFMIDNKMYSFLLEKKYQAGMVQAAIGSQHKVIDPAVDMGYGPIGPKRKLNYIMALIAALVIPLAYVFTKEYFRNTILIPEDIEDLTSIPIIGTIAQDVTKKDLPVIAQPKSKLSESIRGIRTNLNYLTKNKDQQTVMFTSSLSGEGKTFISINLACMYGISGKKTLLIGADLRKPKIFGEFKLENDLGLSNYLVKQVGLEQIINHTDVENLDVILSGPVPPNPAELLDSPEFRDLIEELKESYERIVIDTAPMGIVADAYLIYPLVDRMIFVTRQGVTYKSMIRSMDLRLRIPMVMAMDTVMAMVMDTAMAMVMAMVIM